jgi:hypothetical protein
MKPIRAMPFLFCVISALLLEGCGGGTSSSSNISGTVVGMVAGTTITLLNNATDPVYLTANGPFKFNGAIGSGSPYYVTVLGQTCKITNGSGTVDANGDTVSNVTVDCSANISGGGTVGGIISGLDSGTSVTLQDNGTDSLVISNNGSFVFATALANSATYAVTVLTQPTGKTCLVTNGAGTFAPSLFDVTNVMVTCS